MQKSDIRTFQGLILTLQDHWVRQGCAIVQPLDMEVGAGTSHPMTCLRALGSEPMVTVYMQSSHRPIDGHYDEDPSRLQHYYQFQVMTKPSPDNTQELYPGSLKELDTDPTIHDTRFVKDNWESPTPGVWGPGWKVQLGGMEATQFTYSQQAGGLECKPVTGEITCSLGRLAMYVQGVDSVYDLVQSGGPLGKATYGDAFRQSEVEQSTYNSEYVDVDFLFTCSEQYEKEAQQSLTLENPLPLLACERILGATHSLNLLDVRKTTSVTERQCYILRIHTLTETVVETYYAPREALGFPMCNKGK